MGEVTVGGEGDRLRALPRLRGAPLGGRWLGLGGLPVVLVLVPVGTGRVRGATGALAHLRVDLNFV